MSEVVRVKYQAKTRLDATVATIDRAIDIFATTEDVSRFPPAVTSVATTLPRFAKFLAAVQADLQSSASDAMAVEKYRTIQDVALELAPNAQRIEDLCFMFSNAEDWKAEYEREAANGKLLEQALKCLLNSAKRVAKDTYVEEEQSKLLQSLLKEASEIPPSFAKPSRGSVTLNQHGNGNQFTHFGEGNQNYSTGGQMVTGDNRHPTFNYTGS
ncbi:Ff.00g114400.m01.CDS01 [Fusarium sp. VM40]|nr:Ff.00g114400.m01.CDS01 [Fusarium sp. VM40]